MEQTRLIKTYRWTVAALAAFFCGHIAWVTDWSEPGGAFRYLTIWGFAMSCVVAVQVLRISYGRTDRRLDGFTSATAVVNVMVVFLFWRLYFADNSSVTRDGELQVWWREYYLHGLGAVLMWVDAFFFNRVFQRFRVALSWLLGVVGGYLLWAELFVARFNETPVGSVTSGLPYPFLNNLEFPQRLEFYATNLILAVVVLIVFFALAWGMRRLGLRH